MLIIDDDFEIYKEIRKTLRSEGIYVDFVPGYDVIEQIKQSEICLAVINTNFSAEECFELVKKIRMSKPIPILVLGSRTYIRRIDVFRAGAHGYLENPFTVEECAAYVKSLIDLYWKLHKNEKQGGALILSRIF